MTIGQRIKKLRLGMGLSQADLASKLGVSQVLISQLEVDIGKGTKHVASLAHILKVNALWLETGQGSPELDYIPAGNKEYCKEIEDVIELMMSADGRGREKALIAVKDALDSHHAWQKSLPRARHDEDEAEGHATERFGHEELPNILESEKLASDAYTPDNGVARKDKRH